jgi:hypothetical protein
VALGSILPVEFLAGILSPGARAPAAVAAFERRTPVLEPDASTGTTGAADNSRPFPVDARLQSIPLFEPAS